MNESCQHLTVVRHGAIPSGVLDKWTCERCGAEFYHLEKLQQGPLTIAEPCATLRDQFAMAALQSLMATNWKDCPYPTGYAEEAYKMADVMLQARKQ